jgi:uracil-DNA glycosylase
MLKEEIRAPYFLHLKEFLWEQGVRGPEDTRLPLKVYPHRKLFVLWTEKHIANTH